MLLRRLNQLARQSTVRDVSGVKARIWLGQFLSQLESEFGRGGLRRGKVRGIVTGNKRSAMEDGSAEEIGSTLTNEDSNARAVAAPVVTEESGSRFKIYTKTGDKGTSCLYNGERRRKDDAIFEALGDVDELNSALGVAHAFCESAGPAGDRICVQIEEIQSRLLDVGTAIATPLGRSATRKVDRARFDARAVEKLEEWIDEMDLELPQLRAFILPSGGMASSHLHVARSVCRRAERRVTPLIGEQSVDDIVGKFMNRLSDYLFTAARYAAFRGNYVEVVYKKASP